MMNCCSTIIVLTISPIEMMPTNLPLSRTGRWRIRLSVTMLDAFLNALVQADIDHVGCHDVPDRGVAGRTPLENDFAGVVPF